MPESNRSLERGLAILDCFKPGVARLAHGELVDRTGLPKATITRLTTALRRLGYLDYDPATRAFRLGVPVLSLARAYQVGSEVMQKLSPAIREVAARTGSLVGVAAPHDTDMVYVDQVNFDPKRQLRQVGAGQRLPILLSAVGRAYLGGLAAAERSRWLAHLRERDPQWSRALEREVLRSVAEVRRVGYCVVPWNNGQLAAAGAPFTASTGERFAINIAFAPSPAGNLDLPPQLQAALRELLAYSGNLPRPNMTIIAGLGSPRPPNQRV